MTESQFTQNILAELRKRLPHAVIVKLNDSMTAGLPDFFVTHDGMTTFFEVKKCSWSKAFEALQYETLRRLRRGWYIINTPDGNLYCFDVFQKWEDFSRQSHYVPHRTFESLIKWIIFATELSHSYVNDTD